MKPELRAAIVKAADACETAGLKRSAHLLRFLNEREGTLPEDFEHDAICECAHAVLEVNDLHVRMNAPADVLAANRAADEAIDTARNIALGFTWKPIKPAVAKCEQCNDDSCVECKARDAA